MENHSLLFYSVNLCNSSAFSLYFGPAINKIDAKKSNTMQRRKNAIKIYSHTQRERHSESITEIHCTRAIILEIVFFELLHTHTQSGFAIGCSFLYTLFIICSFCVLLPSLCSMCLSFVFTSNRFNGECRGHTMYIYTRSGGESKREIIVKAFNYTLIKEK